MKRIFCLLFCVLFLTGCSVQSVFPPKQFSNTRWKETSSNNPEFECIYVFNDDATEITEEYSQTPMFVFKNGYYRRVYIGAGGARTIPDEPKITAEITDEGNLLLTTMYEDGTMYQEVLTPLQ